MFICGCARAHTKHEISTHTPLFTCIVYTKYMKRTSYMDNGDLAIYKHTNIHVRMSIIIYIDRNEPQRERTPPSYKIPFLTFSQRLIERWFTGSIRFEQLLLHYKFIYTYICLYIYVYTHLCIAVYKFFFCWNYYIQTIQFII